MGWTDPSTHVYVTNEIVLASTFNTFIKDNLIDLDRRTTITGQLISAAESTASTSYVNLTTAGPAVSVTIGSTGKALVALYGQMSNSTSGSGALMGFAISGATTVAATDTTAIFYISSGAAIPIAVGATILQSALNAGNTTFTAKYRSNGNTANFSSRQILITPLGS